MIGHGDEIRLDLLDRTIADFERLRQVERVRPADRAGNAGAVGQFVIGEHAAVVDEAVGEDEAALLVDQRETAAAQAVVVAVVAEAELLLARQAGDGDEKVRIVGRLHAVLNAIAIGVESRAYGPVVQLECRKVAVGQRDHLGAGGSFAFGHDPFHHRLRCKGRIGKDQRLVGLADDDRLGLGDRAAAQAQANAGAGGIAGLGHRGEQRHLAGPLVGEAQVVGTEAGDRRPEAVARLQGDVVLGDQRIRRPREPAGIVRQKRGAIAVERRVEFAASGQIVSLP
jgi:hypothetical protein